MGGDRDGNPYVTPATTRDVVITARLAATNLYFKAVETLMYELSVWRCSDEARVRSLQICFFGVTRHTSGQIMCITVTGTRQQCVVDGASGACLSSLATCSCRCSTHTDPHGRPRHAAAPSGGLGSLTLTSKQG